VVADKAKAALARGITPIVCVGETLASAKPVRPKPWSSASCRP
jgi:triosephosphate isomerase